MQLAQFFEVIAQLATVPGFLKDIQVLEWDLSFIVKVSEVLPVI